jgi:Holliday junction resolvase-like predicted endonuclease
MKKDEDLSMRDRIVEDLETHKPTDPQVVKALGFDPDDPEWKAWLNDGRPNSNPPSSNERKSSAFEEEVAMRTVEKTLLQFTGQKSRRRSENDQQYFNRVARAGNKLSEKDFDNLPDEAQEWLNDACTALNKRRNVAGFDSAASSRHAKITGDFGEALVLYWLSRDGFECARVDHTGIDLIARNPYTKELMGISVKTRSRRRKGSDDESVTISNDNFDKMETACEAFGCRPYLAVVVDAKDRRTISAFMTPLKHFLEIYPKSETGAFWKMGKRNLEHYSKDREIRSFSFASVTTRWWK